MVIHQICNHSWCKSQGRLEQRMNDFWGTRSNQFGWYNRPQPGIDISYLPLEVSRGWWHTGWKCTCLEKRDMRRSCERSNLWKAKVNKPRSRNVCIITSGNDADSAIRWTPSTRLLKYLAATLGSRTSLTRLSITTTVRLWTSMLRSFSARISIGTRTASAGALTSATNVVEERALMHSGTWPGLDMHFTKRGIWGIRSGLSSVVHNWVAHFVAAVDT